MSESKDLCLVVEKGTSNTVDGSKQEIKVQIPPLTLEELENRAWQQMRYRDIKQDDQEPVDNNKKNSSARAGDCFRWSQEIIVALGTYWNIYGSVIVQMKRKGPFTLFPDLKEEEHHIVLLADDRVIDLTATQFAPEGKGHCCEPPKGMPNLFLVPWKEAMSRYKAIEMYVEKIQPKSRAFQTGNDLPYPEDYPYFTYPTMTVSRKKYGLPIFKDEFYGNRQLPE
jgi:hypothetical protein